MVHSLILKGKDGNGNEQVFEVALCFFQDYLYIVNTFWIYFGEFMATQTADHTIWAER